MNSIMREIPVLISVYMDKEEVPVLLLKITI